MINTLREQCEFFVTMTMVMWPVVVKNMAVNNEEFTTHLNDKIRKYTSEKRKYVFKMIMKVDGFMSFTANFCRIKFVVNKENIG